MTFHWNTCLP